jgi:hypothetical protein
MWLKATTTRPLERDVVAGWQSFVRDGALAFDVNAVVTTARK